MQLQPWQHPDDLWADFETRNRTDLKKAGARRYAADPSLGITVVKWFFRGVMKSACPVHPSIGTHTLADLYVDARLCRRFVAHHANFDVSVLRAINPFLDLPISKIDCTMGRAQALALPGGLDEVCTTLGLKGKDPKGRALVMATCKPQRDGTFNEDFGTYVELMAYCDQDVWCLIGLDAKLPPLSATERLVFERTWRKNEIGLPIDIALATAIAMRRQEIEQESTITLMEVTGNAVTKLSQRQRIMQWANDGNRAAGLESTQKHVVAEKLLDENLHPDVRIVLELLQAEGGSAPLKAQALLDRHVGGYYKDATRYFGARSGRGTSEGANMFNIARPSGKYDGKDGRPSIDQIIDRLKQGHTSLGNTALTDCLRGTIVAPPGWMVCDNDASQAELRFALWLAGDTERLNILATPGSDLYMYNGRRVFNLPETATKATHPKERQTAKNVTLGGNYQLGWRTYMAFLIKTAAENGLRRHEITEIKARSDIDGYRQANPLLVKLWYDLGDAFKFSIYEPPGRIFPVNGKVAFQKDAHGTVWMLLPSGRAVPHYSAHITHGGEMAFFRAKFGAMLRQKAFGGSLLEIFCFAGDTEVLTGTGLKRIDAVTANDKVWDGFEWVSQGGAICQGSKFVKEVCGTRATPDHLTLCCEPDGTQTWHAWGDLSPNRLKSATDLAASLLPDGYRVTKGAENEWIFLYGAIAGLQKKSNAAVTFAMRLLRAARSALEKQRGTPTMPVPAAILACRSQFTTDLRSNFQTPFRDAPTPTYRVGRITGGGEFPYFGRGAVGAERGYLSNTLRRCRTLTTRLLNWTASTMTETTNRVTYNLPPDSTKCLTVEKCGTSKKSELVYDLLDCGPRNRFTIRTRTGHFLLVHNCQSCTRDLVTASEADIENELPDVVLILDVYDSILALAPAAIAKQRSEQMRAIMRRPRAWTTGLPLDCEGYESSRMRK